MSNLPPTVRTFSLQFAALQIGSLSFSGFAEGDAITIAYSAEDVEGSQGSDGEVIFVQKHNNLADLLHAAGQPEVAMAQLKEAVRLFADIGGEGDRWQPEIWKLVEW